MQGRQTRLNPTSATLSVRGFLASYIGDHNLEANFQSMASRPDKKQPVPLHGGTGLFGALAGYAILINVIKGISSHLHSIFNHEITGFGGLC